MTLCLESWRHPSFVRRGRSSDAQHAWPTRSHTASTSSSTPSSRDDPCTHLRRRGGRAHRQVHELLRLEAPGLALGKTMVVNHQPPLSNTRSRGIHLRILGSLSPSVTVLPASGTTRGHRQRRHAHQAANTADANLMRLAARELNVPARTSTRPRRSAARFAESSRNERDRLTARCTGSAEAWRSRISSSRPDTATRLPVGLVDMSIRVRTSNSSRSGSRELR
jgi:hypothetical protein